MKHVPVQKSAAKGLKSLAGDFRLIGRAIADAFRGLSARTRFDSRCCPKLHFAGWR